jgi:hypothetical protein
MPNNNRGRLLNDGLNSGIFAKLERVETPAGTIATMQYPIEVGTEVMQNFILLTAYADKPATFQTSVKASNKKGNLFGIISAGLGGTPGSIVNAAGSLFDLAGFNERKSKSNESFVATTRIAGQVARSPQESIALYIPGSIEIGMSAEYENVESERRGWGGILSGMLQGGVNSLKDMLSPGGEQNRLLKEGKAKNPNKEVSFKEIKERTFTFEYTFAPKSAQETEMVNSIIKTCRWHSHPTLSSQTQFNVPSEWELQFFINGRENPYLQRLRRLVCTKFDVTYGDETGFVSFEDGAPVYITISMGFQEVEPLHRDHIEKGF